MCKDDFSIVLFISVVLYASRSFKSDYFNGIRVFFVGHSVEPSSTISINRNVLKNSIYQFGISANAFFVLFSSSSYSTFYTNVFLPLMIRHVIYFYKFYALLLSDKYKETFPLLSLFFRVVNDNNQISLYGWTWPLFHLKLFP